jgi:hypothetical protein
MLLDIDINMQFSVSRFSRLFVTQLYCLCRFLFVLLAFTLAPLLWGQVSTLPIPPGSSFSPPPPNQCQSSYDQFYISEAGVYAYWALCEVGSNPNIYDYAGRFDLTPASNAWSSGPCTIHGEFQDQYRTERLWIRSLPRHILSRARIFP